ncbi:MAG: hypothetical protein A2504_03085 [Bdellovibrionales bacterium RIFOXYD12_FULL_39_22]|nr:MAG: hypothetical protein A2385_05800 [Bdellovibrionales bacterium RIFOXYB1_FULL_39_21]OFZ42267.1 MAG: hypothetical protein A2485_15830 [Bdellovibrionales bacterium RIFOXYC12_FULL_39_17]OFZ46641.1 MAG: hypothetical protein A2404_03840 [Bdellovibrionales bacterium RIFOXYC1_FULL_39_130]OFZ76082.1 MAG: hypothetical protein A2560_03310 [Bdellovibrionales bacterium RIFOXYD1_FULL_39_84]OFZ93066.1 MAG: hypothetical protein A2504_03085 [Bdellovibrionales bacterium RIFOXYD12_FULL_39_22]HLE09960.1 hy
MIRRFFDYFLIAFFSVVAYLSGEQVFGTARSDMVAESADIVGKILKVSHVVKLKAEGFLAWNDAKEEQSLVLNDQVYVHDFSATTLAFSSGEEVRLASNTLLKIDGTKDLPEINLKSGLVYFKILDEKKSKLSLQMGGKKITFKKKRGTSAELEIFKQEESLKIVVHQGEVQMASQIATDDKVENLDISESQFIELNGQESIPIEAVKVREATLFLQKPNDGEKIVSYENSGQVEFFWKQLASGKATKIQVAKDRKFENILFEERVELGVTSLFFNYDSPGSFYWRALTVIDDGSEEEEEMTPPHSFSIVKNSPPEFYYPEEGSTIFLDEDGRVLNKTQAILEWQSKQDADYFLELYKGEDNVVGQRQKTNRYKLSSFSEGAYRFRVKYKNLDMPDSPWTSFRNFFIERVQLPRINTLAAPSDGEEFITNPQGIDLRWEADKNAVGYLIMLATDMEFENVVVRKTVYDHEFNFMPEKFSTYFWKVMPIDRLQRKTTFSPIFSFSLANYAVEPHFPTAQDELVLKSVDDKISFLVSGTMHPQVQYYLQIGVSENFEGHFFEAPLSTSAYKWEESEEGQFFWRIKMADPYGIISYSQAIPIKIEQAPELKKPVIDLQNIEQQMDIKRVQPKKRKNKNSTFLHRFFNFIISSAYAESVESEEYVDIVSIRWPKQKLAVKYCLEIYRDEKGQRQLLSTIVSGVQYDWKDPQQGRVFWRIAVIDKWGRQSPFSDLIALDVVLPESLKPFDPPRLIWPLYDQAIDLKDSMATFSWQGAHGSIKYQFVIAHDDQFKVPIFKTELTGQSVAVDLSQIVQRKALFWQVVAWNNLGKKSTTIRQKVIINPPKRRKKITHPGLHKNLAMMLTPSFVKYKSSNEELNIEINFDGIVYTSFALAGQWERSNGDFFAMQSSRTSGEVFGEVAYQDNELYLSYNRFYSLGLSLPTYIGLGVGGDFITQLERKNGDFTNDNELFYELLLLGGIEWGTAHKSRWIHVAELGIGGGSTLHLQLKYQLSFELFNTYFLFVDAALTKRFLYGKEVVIELDQDKIGIGIKKLF